MKGFANDCLLVPRVGGSMCIGSGDSSYYYKVRAIFREMLLHEHCEVVGEV